MPEENKNPSDAFAEKLIPTRVLVTRQRGDFTYIFEIDGYRGEQTGEISYKASEIKKVEEFLHSGNPIYSFNSRTFGLVLNWESPMVVVGESTSTGTLSQYEEIFKLQSKRHRVSPQFGY